VLENGFVKNNEGDIIVYNNNDDNIVNNNNDIIVNNNDNIIVNNNNETIMVNSEEKMIIKNDINVHKVRVENTRTPKIISSNRSISVRRRHSTYDWHGSHRK